jgi:hypothetical protein
MSWDRTGQTIRGKYIGEYTVEGKVISSRIALGARVKHMVETSQGWTKTLSNGIHLGGLLIIDEQNIETVVDTKA